MRTYEVVPGDQLMVEWEDVPDELVLFVDVAGLNEDDVPTSYHVVGVHGLATIDVDQVVERGSNIFARNSLS